MNLNISELRTSAQGTEKNQRPHLQLAHVEGRKSSQDILRSKEGKRKNINESADNYVPLYEANSLKQRCLGLFSWLPTKSASTESFFMPDGINLKTEAFSRMQRLKLLQLNYARVYGGFGGFPRTLKWLYWRGFSFSYLLIFIWKIWLLWTCDIAAWNLFGGEPWLELEGQIGHFGEEKGQKIIKIRAEWHFCNYVVLVKRLGAWK